MYNSSNLNIYGKLKVCYRWNCNQCINWYFSCSRTNSKCSVRNIRRHPV